MKRGHWTLFFKPLAFQRTLRHLCSSSGTFCRFHVTPHYAPNMQTKKWIIRTMGFWHQAQRWEFGDGSSTSNFDKDDDSLQHSSTLAGGSGQEYMRVYKQDGKDGKQSQKRKLGAHEDAHCLAQKQLACVAASKLHIQLMEEVRKKTAYLASLKFD